MSTLTSLGTSLSTWGQVRSLHCNVWHIFLADFQQKNISRQCYSYSGFCSSSISNTETHFILFVHRSHTHRKDAAVVNTVHSLVLKTINYAVPWCSLSLFLKRWLANPYEATTVPSWEMNSYPFFPLSFLGGPAVIIPMVLKLFSPIGYWGYFQISCQGLAN